MCTLREIALETSFIGPETVGEEVYRRFDADFDLMVIAVVAETGAPLGLIERNTFMLKMGSTYGRALYAGRPVAPLMDADPLIVEADTRVADFTEASLAQRPSDLMRGFIVVADGAFVGAGTTLALLQAVAEENRIRTRELYEAGQTLRSAEGRLYSAHLLLTQALDAMSEGVAIFDAEDRCVLWNAKYAQSHQESADILAPGISFEALLRHGVKRGQYVDALGREEEWMAERLRRRATFGDQTSEEQELPNGRCIRVEETRLESGALISVAVDITDIRRREASFRLLFESNPVPLVVFDQESLNILASNQAATVKYGYRREDLAALELSNIIVPEDRAAGRAFWLDSARHGSTSEQSFTFLTASGERKRIMPYMHPLTYHGRPATLVAAVDITVQHEAETALKNALERAEEADRAKSEFLANMSHELRTPLNGVVGMASVLARTQLGPAQREMVQVIETSATTLDALLSDVLDLAKIEAGRIELQSEVVAPDGLARHVAALFGAPAAEKGLSFQLDLDSDAARPVLADTVRLTQVLTNLCSNAVKFTERGGVTLAVRSRRAADRVAVTFAVSDTGIGLSAEAKARVFDRFAQADGSITRRFGGTGLGLSISLQLTELMGGRLEVDSREGRGSTFTATFEFPAAPSFELDAPAHASDAPRAASGAALPRVLLVEDHPVNRKVVQLMLDGVVELEIAVNGLEAVEAVKVQRYDIILMDMQMPVMDGATATRTIRALEAERRRPRTPIVILTANALPEHVALSLGAGADAHLPKPITAKALMAALETALEPPTVRALASASA